MVLNIEKGKMKYFNAILIFLFISCFTGCITLYEPNTINSPMLKLKGDLNVTGVMGLSGCGLSNLQAAYAPTKHLGIVLNTMYHYKKSGDNSVQGGDIELLRIYACEAGGGYFTSFRNMKNSYFQIYGGLGTGYAHDKVINLNTPAPEVSASYGNLYLQPGIYYTGKQFDIGFDIKANDVRIYNIHAYLYNKFEWWNTDFHYYSDTVIHFINLEPQVTFRVGGNKIKGLVQSGITIPIYNSSSFFLVNTPSMLLVPLFKFTVGISFNLGNKRNK